METRVIKSGTKRFQQWLNTTSQGARWQGVCAVIISLGAMVELGHYFFAGNMSHSVYEELQVPFSQAFLMFATLIVQLIVYLKVLLQRNPSVPLGLLFSCAALTAVNIFYYTETVLQMGRCTDAFWLMLLGVFCMLIAIGLTVSVLAGRQDWNDLF